MQVRGESVIKCSTTMKINKIYPKILSDQIAKKSCIDTKDLRTLRSQTPSLIIVTLTPNTVPCIW